MDTNDDDIYIILHNYTDNGKIFGIVEKQSLYTSAAWFVPMSFINFKLLPFSIDVRIFIEILVIIPPTLFILIGVGGDTLLDFARNVFKFYKQAKTYYYGK